jgi:hypothetical protein
MSTAPNTSAAPVISSTEQSLLCGAVFAAGACVASRCCQAGDDKHSRHSSSDSLVSCSIIDVGSVGLLFFSHPQWLCPAGLETRGAVVMMVGP